MNHVLDFFRSNPAYINSLIAFGVSLVLVLGLLMRIARNAHRRRRQQEVAVLRLMLFLSRRRALLENDAVDPDGVPVYTSVQDTYMRSEEVRRSLGRHPGAAIRVDEMRLACVDFFHDAEQEQARDSHGSQGCAALMKLRRRIRASAEFLCTAYAIPHEDWPVVVTGQVLFDDTRMGHVLLPDGDRTVPDGLITDLSLRCPLCEWCVDDHRPDIDFKHSLLSADGVRHLAPSLLRAIEYADAVGRTSIDDVDVIGGILIDGTTPAARLLSHHGLSASAVTAVLDTSCRVGAANDRASSYFTGASKASMREALAHPSR